MNMQVEVEVGGDRDCPRRGRGRTEWGQDIAERDNAT